METGEVTFSETPPGPRVSLRFYVGPIVEGQPEAARARAIVHGQVGTDIVECDIAAAELDRMAMEWLDARGKFNLDAFTAGLAAADAAADQPDPEPAA